MGNCGAKTFTAHKQNQVEHLVVKPAHENQTENTVESKSSSLSETTATGGGRRKRCKQLPRSDIAFIGFDLTSGHAASSQAIDSHGRRKVHPTISVESRSENEVHTVESVQPEANSNGHRKNKPKHPRRQNLEKDSVVTDATDKTPPYTPRFPVSDDGANSNSKGASRRTSSSLVPSEAKERNESHKKVAVTKVHTLAAAHERWKRSQYSKEMKETSAVDISRDEHGNIIVNGYVIYEEIGHGAYGAVHRCISMKDGNTYAAKVLKRSFLKKQLLRKKNSKGVEKESEIWKSLNHPNLVKLVEGISDPADDRIYLISEFVNGGSVMPDELEHSPIDVEDARYFFAQLVDALIYIHKCKIAHRDIKPGNMLIKIPQKYELKSHPYNEFPNAPKATDEGLARSLLSKWSKSNKSRPFRLSETEDTLSEIGSARELSMLDDDMEFCMKEQTQEKKAWSGGRKRRSPISTAESHGMILKLGDFGVAQVFKSDNDFVRNTAGTASFQAPETLSGKHYSAKLADIWAAGITLYMLLYGRTPFWGTNLMQIYNNIRDTELHFPDNPDIPPEAKSLISNLLHKDPEKRPSLDDLKYHRFLRDCYVGSFSMETKPILPPLYRVSEPAPSPVDKLASVIRTKMMVRGLGKPETTAGRRNSLAIYPITVKEEDNKDGKNDQDPAVTEYVASDRRRRRSLPG